MCARNTFARPLDRRIFFLWFEKCGGTSVNSAIRGAYLRFTPEGFYEVVRLSAEGSLAASAALGKPLWRYRTELLQYFMSQHPVRYISGHFQVDGCLLDEFQDRFAFVTVLRNPVERWISHYFYNRYKRSIHGRINQDIESYLESARGRGLGSDFVRLLLGEGDREPQEEGGDVWPQKIRQAKEHLERFELVGRVEELDRFAAAFQTRFGTRLRIGHKNTNPAPITEVSTAVRRKIEQVCGPNLELYRYARSLL